MNLPSKELLSEALGRPCFTEDAFMNSNLLTYSEKDYKFTGHTINIHELVHKCKELIKLDYTIEKHSSNEYRKGWFEIIVHKDRSSVFANIPFKASTEQDVVFQACQWFIDNKATL